MLRLAKRYNSSVAAAAEAYKHYDAIPGPKCYPYVGSVPNYLPVIGKYDNSDAVKSGIRKFYEFGSIYKERFFGQEVVFLYDPKDIETLFRKAGNSRRSHSTLGHVRINSEVHVNGGILYENGAKWSKLRTGSQQSLTMDAVKEYLPKVDQLTLRFLQKIKDDPMTANVMEKDFLLALLAHNCDVMGYLLFGFNWDCINEVLDDNATTTRVIHSSTYFNRMMATMDNGPMLWKMFQTPLYKKLKKCSEEVDFFPIREVQKRLRDRSLADGPGILNKWINEGQLSGKTMITVLADMLLAGIDTTSYTLGFAMYNLCVNKAAQDKLYAEIVKLKSEIGTSGEHNSVQELEALSQAKYLRQVVKESLRLFPVSVGTSRTLEKPCVIGGYQFPANVTIITLNQVTSRLEEFVERGNEFIPERYDADSGFKKIPPFTSLPFGHGARGCIGRRAAEMTMYTFLFRLIGEYEIRWTGKKPLGYVTYSLTEPNGPLHFEFRKRDPPRERF